MSYFYIYRNVLLGLCLLLTIPNLGLNAHWTQGTMLVDIFLSFEGMGLAISCLSILVFPMMVFVSEFRQKAFISYIISEIMIVLLMWVLWMTAAILVIQEREIVYPLNTCSLDLFIDQVHWCKEMFAIQGLSVTIFVLLLKYLLMLLIFAFRNHSNGVSVWTTSVKDLASGTSNITTQTSKVDIEGKLSASLFSATGYTPPQQVSYAQPTNSSTQLATPSNPPAQVNQLVSFSQNLAGSTPPPQIATPGQQTYTNLTQFAPPSLIAPAVPEV